MNKHYAKYEHDPLKDQPWWPSVSGEECLACLMEEQAKGTKLANYDDCVKCFGTKREPIPWGEWK